MVTALNGQYAVLWFGDRTDPRGTWQVSSGGSGTTGGPPTVFTLPTTGSPNRPTVATTGRVTPASSTVTTGRTATVATVPTTGSPNLATVATTGRPDTLDTVPTVPSGTEVAINSTMD